MNFIPNRVIITPTAKVHPRTESILNRIISLNRNVEIIDSTNQQPKLPDELTELEKFNYLQETILLCTRSKAANYMEIFASPGNIAENLGVMGKIINGCNMSCKKHFCYLTTAGRSVPWTRIYVDIENFIEQALKEKYVYMIVCSLWTAISFYLKQPLNKVPKNFKQVCDKFIRSKVLSPRNEINNKKDAVHFLRSNLASLFRELEIQIKRNEFNLIRNNLDKYFRKNKELPLYINIGEYTDICAYEHLTENISTFLDAVDNYPDLHIKFRTKFPNLDGFIKHRNLSHVSIAVDLNTTYNISTFQDSCYKLDQRIAAVNLLISKGVKVQLAIEPIIKYKGYEKDYISLMKMIEHKIDLTKIESIKVGTVRYKTILLNKLRKLNGNTDHLNDGQALVEPETGDKRWRYSVDDRINIYSMMINALSKKYQRKVSLGSENPEIWERLGINLVGIHNKVLYQYSPKIRRVRVKSVIKK
ncbi:MAG: hypothetical protein RDU14_02640 [Melioribacteraceae bacterium]|nr:hypothetical protein [Melioribacteraceae bacterium]